MLRFSISLFFIALASVSLHTQTSPRDSLMSRKEFKDLERTQHLWYRTDNASGLSLAPVGDGSISSVAFGRSLNGYHRAQEGDAESTQKFRAERFDNIGKYIKVFSAFGIEKEREYNRAWSDVIRTYNSNPYFPGSAVKGNYDALRFILQAKVASVRIHRFTYGIGLDYQVEDLSRLRDPRSRSRLEEYSFKPGITYQLSTTQTVGLRLKYGHRKEKIPSVITVQTDPTLQYYTFTGMEHGTGTTSGYNGFKREFVDQSWGWAFNYAFQKRSFQSLTTFSFEKGKENVWELYKGSPGYYQTTEYQFISYNNIRTSRFLHALQLEGRWNKGKATEFKQQLVTTTDSLTGYTSKHWNTIFEYKNRYQVDVTDIRLDYTLYSSRTTTDYNYYVGISARYYSFKNKYNLPVSLLQSSKLETTLKGGYRLIDKPKSKLWVEPAIAYAASLDASLALNDASTDYAQNVLLPDLDYYKASYVKTSLAVQYLFPFGMKNIRNLWYVKVNADYLKANNSTHTKAGWISIGIYTR